MSQEVDDDRGKSRRVRVIVTIAAIAGSWVVFETFGRRVEATGGPADAVSSGTYWDQVSLDETESARKATEEARARIIRRELERQRKELAAEMALRVRPDLAAALDSLGTGGTPGECSHWELANNFTFTRHYKKWIHAFGGDNREKKAACIGHFRRQLEAHGTDLVYLLIPNKLDTYAYLFCENVGDTSICPEQTKLMIQLLEHDVEVLDLRKEFRRAARERGEAVFYRHSHHWAPPGIAIAAREVFDRLKRYDILAFADTYRAEFEVRQLNILGEVENHVERPELTPGTIALNQVFLSDGIILRDPGSPVYFLGDSNAVHLDWMSAGLRAQLSRKIGLPVYTQGRGGAAPSVPRDFKEKYLSCPPKVLVWVMESVLYPDERWIPTDLGPPSGGIEKADAGFEIDGPDRYLVRIGEGAAIPDPKLSPYKDALVVYEARLLAGESEEVIHLLTWAYRDRILSQRHLETGGVYALQLEEFADAQARDGRIEFAQIIDNTSDYAPARYWWEPVEVIGSR